MSKGDKLSEELDWLRLPQPNIFILCIVHHVRQGKQRGNGNTWQTDVQFEEKGHSGECFSKDDTFHTEWKNIIGSDAILRRWKEIFPREFSCKIVEEDIAKIMMEMKMFIICMNNQSINAKIVHRTKEAQVLRRRKNGKKYFS